ncbi:MAG: OmpA family protein [Candidatus Falkowbacteria bacterium]
MIHVEGFCEGAGKRIEATEVRIEKLEEGKADKKTVLALSKKVETNSKNVRANTSAVSKLRSLINKNAKRIGMVEDAVKATRIVHVFLTSPFDPKSSELTPRMKEELDILSNTIVLENIVLESFTGHADIRGVEKKNLTLSLERAKVAKEYMGITDAKVTGDGETDRYGSYGDNRCVAIVGRYVQTKNTPAVNQ